MNGMRFVGVALGFAAVLSFLPAWRRGEWSVVLDSIAMVLLALVIWFAVQPGSEQLHPPKLGTRTLRLALYWTILLLCVASGSGRYLAGDAWGCGNVTTALLVGVFLAPLIRSELDAGKHEAGS
jgi:hypothetical protein